MNPKCTIIIPYNRDRGYLQEAIDSVPKDVQLILSKGDGTWPENFNKALPQAKGEFIKYLHEDDRLTMDSIKHSLEIIEFFTKIDFMHGNAIEVNQVTKNERLWVPPVKLPTFSDLLKNNTIHSATVLYRREIFEKIGGFNESREVYSFEEYEFNLRVLKAGFNIGYVNAPLAYYRRHKEQIIRTVNNQERQQNRKKMLICMIG